LKSGPKLKFQGTLKTIVNWPSCNRTEDKRQARAACFLQGKHLWIEKLHV